MIGATLLLATLPGCARDSFPAGEDDAAVYEALLTAHCCIDRAIVQEVTTTEDEREPPRLLSREIQEAVSDLGRRTGTARSLPDSLAVSIDDRRVSTDSMKTLLEQMRATHARRMPDSSTIVLLPRVGYSRDGMVAVVRMTEICGILCGGSTLRALRRHPAGWLPAETVEYVVY